LLIPQLLAVFVALSSLALTGEAADNYSTGQMLDMSMQELMNIKVVSVSKREEDYFNTAAATFIITRNDIRRAGARNIPEALRLAPGVEVNRANGNQYAIAIREQNDLLSDKLLVLMDGRPLYTPTFSGVWWVAQNYPMDDIERIEVIRGPSGAIWGANAVNGVINIITRDAHNTTGVHLSAGGGNEERGFGSLRIGADSGKGAFRAYLMGENRDGGIVPNANEQALFSQTGLPGFQAGSNANDGRRFAQGGFRADWNLGDKSSITLHGDAYKVKSDVFGSHVPQPYINFAQPYQSTSIYKGYNLVAKADSRLSSNTSMTTQLFYDQYKIDSTLFGERRDTIDADLQFNFSQLPRNLISVGTNFRTSSSKFQNTGTMQAAGDRMNMVSLFLNDEIEVIEKRLRLIAGVKLEKNSYMSWQVQPHLRTIYTTHSWGIWAAVSKAVRSPNMIDNNVQFNIDSFPTGIPGTTAPTPTLGAAIGIGAVDPERIVSYEAGIRIHPDNDLLLQLTAFHIDYANVADAHIEPARAFATASGIVIPAILRNVLSGKSNGVEIDLSYRINEQLKIKGTYSYLRQNYTPLPGVLDAESLFTAMTVTQQSPRHRYSAGISIDPAENLELDLNLYGWSKFRNDTIIPVVAAYNRLDARVGWQASENLTVSLAGQNLLKPLHREEIDNVLGFSSLVQRSFYLKTDYNF